MEHGTEEDVRRFAKADLDDVIKSKFKTFLKEPCAECGKPAVKRFNGTMSFIVGQLADSYWCNECGRILCESHRYQHKCERLDQQKERNKHLTHDQMAARIAQEEALRQARDEETKAAARQEAEAHEEQRQLRRGRRELIAKKAKQLEDFLQGICRDTDTNARRGPQARDELLDMWTRAKRIALTLYNEFEHPTLPGLAEDDWRDATELYQRAQELTGMYISVEGEPLSMRNPWDQPPPP